MSFSFKIRATLSGTYYDSISGSTRVTLDSIPRASSVSIPETAMGMGVPAGCAIDAWSAGLIFLPVIPPQNAI